MRSLAYPKPVWLLRLFRPRSATTPLCTSYAPIHSAAQVRDSASREFSWEEILPAGEGDDGPVIKAAGLADPTVLRNLLTRAATAMDPDELASVISWPHDEALDGRWITALGRAIERQRPANIATLLEYGIDPNGVDITTLKEVSRKFRRHAFVPRHRILQPYAPTTAREVNAVLFQTAPLTQMEVESRRAKVSRFWIEPDSAIADHSMEYERLHSVVMAGQTTPEIFDQVLESGADVSFWLGRECSASLPPEDDLTPSALSVSTPVHSALAADNAVMVRAILDRGFDPNARPIITGSHALTPAQYAIIIGNIEAYRLLRAHPDFRPDILTPVYGVHSLHFAAAQLNAELLGVIGLPLASAPCTSIGHTLLHIACLPYDEDVIKTSGPKAAASYHDTRWPDATQYRHRRVWPTTWGLSGQEDCMGYAERDKDPRDMYLTASEQWVSQDAMCKLPVSELGPKTIAQCDMHGNTALHYLAGVEDLNLDLIEWLRSQHGANAIWHGSVNYWGHTPINLLKDRAMNGPSSQRRLSRRKGGPPLIMDELMT